MEEAEFEESIEPGKPFGAKSWESHDFAPAQSRLSTGGLAFRILDGNLFQRDALHFTRLFKRKCQLYILKFPVPDKLQGSVDHFEIVSFCRVRSPLVRPLEIKPCRNPSQQCFHLTLVPIPHALKDTCTDLIAYLVPAPNHPENQPFSRFSLPAGGLQRREIHAFGVKFTHGGQNHPFGKRQEGR